MEYNYVGFYRKYVEDLKQEGNQYLGWCPFHEDRGSKVKSFSVNPETGLWHCFSCVKGGNAITFCRLKDLAFEKAPDYDPNFEIYSYPGGAIKKKRRKKDSGKSFHWAGPEEARNKSLYNPAAIDRARELDARLWIAEGEKDTIALIEAGELAVGLPSARMTKLLKDDALEGISEVIVALDNDPTGKQSTDQIKARFPFVYKVEWPEDRPKGFDVSELKEEDPEGFVETLREWADPYLRQISFLLAKYHKDKNRDPDIPLGYRLNEFETLAQNIDGIQPGFYVVGAETNVGKTAFLCNLTLDLLDSNEDLMGLYFSLDDNREVIFNRLLSIKTGIPLNKVQKKQPTERHESMLKQGYNYLNQLTMDKRLLILDSSDIHDISQLELEIRQHSQRNLSVVIDALHNLDVGDARDNLRKENIERANKLKVLASTYQIPLICTGELRKKERKEGMEKTPTIHDLMETGKFAYNANLVLLLYPDNWEDFDMSDEPILTVKYAKNKLSHYRGKQYLKFFRDTSKLVERSEIDEFIEAPASKKLHEPRPTLFRL